MGSKRPSRLRRNVYIGRNRYSVTIRAARNSRPFIDSVAIEPTMVQLRQSAAACHFALLAYCFMPDHLHLVVEGIDGHADLVQFVSRFKQRSGYAHRQAMPTALWQEGFYDRVLRKDESTAAAVRYVLANPVRAGLVRSIAEWPFCGSDVFRIRDLGVAVPATMTNTSSDD